MYAYTAIHTEIRTVTYLYTGDSLTMNDNDVCQRSFAQTTSKDHVYHISHHIIMFYGRDLKTFAHLTGIP